MQDIVNQLVIAWIILHTLPRVYAESVFRHGEADGLLLALSALNVISFEEKGTLRLWLTYGDPTFIEEAFIILHRVAKCSLIPHL